MEECRKTSATLEAVVTQVVDAAFKVHKALGPGLLESVYQTCLVHELELRGLSVEAQLLSYLKLAGKRLGLLINFNVPVIKQGIRRIIL